MTGPIEEKVVRSLADVPEGEIRDRLLSSINLMDNYNRGWVAEVVVAELLGADMVGEGYGDWDLEYRGKRIEVKSAGDIQSWRQKSKSDVKFGIARTEGFVNQPDGSYVSDAEKLRRSDAYVFCHHTGVIPDNPQDWIFYVVPTSKIDEVCGDQKSITLNSLKKRLGPFVSDAGSLVQSVDKALSLLENTEEFEEPV